MYLVCEKIAANSFRWKSVKISTSARHNGRTEEYLKYCKKPMIVYLAKNAQVENMKQIKFVL